MKKKLSILFTSFLLLAGTFLVSQPSYADRLDWRVDGQLQSQYNSNIPQIADFPGSDFLFNPTVVGTVRYTLPSQTQFLARVSGQYNKFTRLTDFDVVVLAGSLTASQWFFNSLNIYAGIQPIQLISMSTDRRPFDMVYLTGLTYYYPIGKTLAFGGYQFDRLNAAAADYSSWNHTVIAGVRHPILDNLFGNVGGRVRVRNLDLSPNDARYSGNMSLQYVLNKWLTLQVGGEYTYVNSESPTKTLGFYNLGINIIGGYNDSINF